MKWQNHVSLWKKEAYLLYSDKAMENQSGEGWMEVLD